MFLFKEKEESKRKDSSIKDKAQFCNVFSVSSSCSAFSQHFCE